MSHPYYYVMVIRVSLKIRDLAILNVDFLNRFVMFRQNVATICFWFVGLHYQLSDNPKSTYFHDVDIDAKLLITLPNKIYTSISASTNQNNVFVDLFVNLEILQQR